jgi:hypothetical protein
MPAVSFFPQSSAPVPHAELYSMYFSISFAVESRADDNVSVKRNVRDETVLGSFESALN